MTDEDPFEAIMRSKREDAERQREWQQEMFDLEHKGQRELSALRIKGLRGKRKSDSS